MQRKYRYRRKLPHIQNAERPIYVSFNTKNRWELPPVARDAAFAAILKEHHATCLIEALVIMPDHVHLLFHIGRDEEGWPIPVGEIMRRIKGRSAFAINRAIARSGQVWQAESFDRILRSYEKAEAVVEYIRANPVERGLVKDADDYPWLWISPTLLAV